MKKERKDSDRLRAHLRSRRLAPCLLLLICKAAAAQADSPIQLRQFIDQQSGGIRKLQVPATDIDIPVPRLADGSVNPRYRTTEAKRYLGKLLFHDPVRTARIDPAYGGVPATRQTGSCGSCGRTMVER